MDTSPVLVDGSWRASSGTSTFRAHDPTTGAELAQRFPISDEAEIARAVEAAARAAPRLADAAPELRAAFLERYADLLERHRDELAAVGERETALPAAPRLAGVELPRTTGQLRQAARAVRERSWCLPVIDTAAGIRAQFEALGGPVVVFGPNNFPFAFNAVAGGDFAAAVAAGNPVIAKGHPAHPGTTRLLAELAERARGDAGLPEATVQLVYDMPPAVGLELVAHPEVAAVGFTGSRRAGMALKGAADRAGTPIYVEMGSVNPVFLLPGALEAGLDEVVAAYGASCLLAGGQFCTNPGLSVAPAGDLGEAFVAAVAAAFREREPGVLFAASGVRALVEAVATLTGAGARVVEGGAPVDAPGFRFAPTLLRIDAASFLAQPATFQTEAFGPVGLIVLAEPGRMREVAAALEGSLTASVYSDPNGGDDALYAELAPVLRRRVGRLLNDKMPTGVAVSPAMVHGGPYPATGHPGFTSVGLPASIRRFAALRAYDNVRDARLPAELRDANPLGIWRNVDGAWTTGTVGSRTVADAT